MTENCKFRKAILSAFYNILQRNFGILLILWCSFKLWWNFCLDLLSSKFWLIGEWSIEQVTYCIISTDEDPGLRIESFAVINLRGVSTNKTIIKINCCCDFRCDFLLLMDVNEWMSYECSDEGTCTPNIHNPSPRSHASEGENRTRNHSKKLRV
jgi:hypothetical protein